MKLQTKRNIIGSLGLLFLVSPVFVQGMEVLRRRQESGLDQAVGLPIVGMMP